MQFKYHEPSNHLLRFTPYTGISDHCCISLTIDINTSTNTSTNTAALRETNRPPDYMVHSLTYKFTYDSDRKNIFKQNLLNNEDINSLADTLTKVEFGKFDIDYCITKVNEILITAAKKSFPFKKFTNRTKRRRHNKNCWYTRDCKSLRTVLRKHSRDLSREPFSRRNLDLFVKSRSASKKHAKKPKRNIAKP